MSSTPAPVIVVDDDAAVRNSLKFALELEGFDVRTYGGGSGMLADLGDGSASCLIVDQYMPGMSGIDLADRLRERHSAIPIILITAKATDELRWNAAQRGIAQVLEKPFRDVSLLDAIRGAIEGRQARPDEGQRPPG